MIRSDEATVELVESLAGATVLIVGDAMLDDYILGDALRVNPEAPVPLIRLARRMGVPGGAANVARGVVALGGKALLTAVVGDDTDGKRLRAALQAWGISDGGLVVATDRPTTTKLRVIARGKHIVRVDHERCQRLDSAVGQRIVDWVRSHILEVDAVVVSDYAKGVLSTEICTRIIAFARDAGAPVIVDPKGADPARYAGASVITPNVAEAELLVGDANRDSDPADVRSLASRLARALPGTAVLITRGQDGMLLQLGDGRVVDVEVQARDVHDVTGAGDTVVATLATALARGTTLEEAIGLSGRAASIAVTRLGATAVTLDELANDDV